VDDRTKWTVFAVLLAVLGGGVAAVALGGGDDDDRAGGGRLTVERAVVPGTRQPELLVSVDKKLNVPDTAKNGRTVGLHCVDGQGRKVLSARVEWPFLDEPNYPLPHAHQPTSSQDLARIASCRVTGTTVRLEGRMRLRN
jgi:hypothetical protein